MFPIPDIDQDSSNRSLDGFVSFKSEAFQPHSHRSQSQSVILPPDVDYASAFHSGVILTATALLSKVRHLASSSGFTILIGLLEQSKLS